MTADTRTDAEPRSQRERREATRALLLEATIDCLVEHGYAGMTTTRVAERAGVSRGAQVHHFPTKAELVSEAIDHMARRRSEQLLAEWHVPAPGEDRVAAALDFLWRSHSGTLMLAGLELWVAARTDDELRRCLTAVEDDLGRAIRRFSAALFGVAAPDAEFDARLDLALGAIRGIALLAMLRPAGERDLENEWRECRSRLTELFPPSPATNQGAP